jgi:hypothetical protein
MKVICILAVATFSITGLAETAFANNSWFLPGDAFFFVRISKSNLIKIQKQKSPVFHYGNPGGAGVAGGAGCGHAGYPDLRIVGMPQSMKSQLLECYKKFESQLLLDFDNKHRPFFFFIYNEEYDWKKNGLGIQYNEDWVKQTVKFGYSREHVRLESFTNLTMIAWRDSPIVPGLRAFVPPIRNVKDSRGAVPRRVSGPVILTNKYKILFTPRQNLSDYFPYPKSGLKLVEITSKGMTTYVRKDKNWVIKK